MISGSRIEGGTQILSSRVRNTIQSIKEIVGNHSDADIYVALKETNMDPNETTQKLLNQDPFHEVRRKRDKKKENAGYKGSTDPRKYNDHEDQGMKFNTYSDRNVRRGNSRNGILVAGISREFRVVRDNRMTQNANREMKPASPQYSTFTDKQVFSHISEKGSRGTYSNQKPSGKSDSSQALDGPSINTRKETSEERRGPAPSAISQGQPLKLNDSQSHSVAPASNNSVVGVYSSSSDPVHVPSDSRSAASVGAIKREIGVVGVRRKTSENSVKYLSQSGSFPNSQLGRDRPSSRESFRPFSAISKNDQPSQSSLPESIIPSMNVGRSFLSSQNQYNSRPNQQLVGHQKVTQANKEWKPKSTQKSSVNGPEVIDMPSKFVPPPQVDNNRDLETETAQLQDKPSRGTTFENQNVIIAEHIRVNETDRSRLTFGSFGPEFDTSGDSLSGSQAFGTSEESSAKPSTSARLLASSPESSSDETSGNKYVDSPDGQVQNSGSISPASDSVSEHQPPYKTESSSPPSLDNFADIGLVQDHNPSYTPSDSQELDIPELPSFSTYDPQTGYDIPYFRPGMDEGVKGQGSPFAQESLRSQTTNIPGSTIAMVQQQQPPMAQMYPQVHVSHFANLMPYRHYLSPVYVPPMPMPGYSNNHPSYPHPPNGSSYLLMPGGGSHLSASNHKYGIQQFKPVPTGSPTGFGNFHSPTGYAINAPGVVSSATGIEDSSRLKYKDVNLYVPNQQAETSEIWYQNPRDLPGMQSTASYYNMPTQTPHATYLPSHTSHASFNAAAAAQSSHIQYQGLYHHAQPQPGPIASPHHMGPAMGGGNVGVGVAAVAPGSQVGPYQQPQLGHLNWTPSF